jgi:hypothetical protein
MGDAMMKKCTRLMFAAVAAAAFLTMPAARAQVFSDDFEDADLSGWTEDTAGNWANSASTPITGTRSLKHNLSGVVGTNYIHASPVYGVNTAATTWRLNMKNGNWDPSTANRFWFMLMSDEPDPRSATADGYAVGVFNAISLFDSVALVRVTGGTATFVNVVASSVDWGSAQTVGLEVTRDTAGLWELKVDSNGGYDGLVSYGTATDTTYTNTAYIGASFEFTSTRAGQFWVDDVSISQGAAAITTNVLFAGSAASVSEDSTSYTVTVYKTQSSGNVAGQVALSGTATNGVSDDYTINTTNFVLNGATTAATFVVTINDDAVTESSETILLTLANVVGAGVAAPSTFTLTLQDDDAPTSTSLVISQYTETDSGTTPKGIEVWNVSGADITFDSGANAMRVLVGVNGATLTTSATISAGTLVSGDVWVIGTSDMSPDTTVGFTFNGDDAVAVSLGGVIQDVIGTPGSDPGSAWSGSGVSTENQNIQLKPGITVGDTDGWTDPSLRYETVGVGSTLTGFGTAPGSSPATNVSFTVPSASAGEAAGTYNVTIIKSLATGSVTGQVTLGGSATEGGGNDYTISSTNFVLEGATTSATLTVTINNDAAYEGLETLVLTLANVTGGSPFAPTSFTLSILDNDPPPSATASVWINEVDYDTVGTDTNEWVEIIGLAGLSLNDYELLMIADNGTTNNVIDLAGASWTFIDEGGGYGYCVVGIVTPGEGTADYTPAGWDSGEMQNGPGDSLQLRQKTGPLNVHLIDYAGDNLTTVENQLTGVGDLAAALSSLYLTGGPGTNFNSYTWTNTAGSATPGAANNGQSFAAGGPVTNVLFTAAAATVSEEVGTYNVTVYKSLTDGNVTGQVALSGTATLGGGNDYTIDTTNFTLNGATTAAVLTITVNDDAGVEPTETVILTLANVTGGSPASPSVFTLSITNNDVAPPPSVNVWINEMHYDNVGGDLDEGFEVAGPAGTDLSSYQITLYEGADGSVYSNRTLTGVIANQMNGFGVVWFDFSNASGTGLQPGPDGFALSLVEGGVTSLIKFWSYEGTFAGAAGPADGVTSTDLGLSEGGSGTNSTPIGHSLQLCGTGTSAVDFVWTTWTATNSMGAFNVCQTIPDPNDLDGDGLPDDWENTRFGSTTNEPAGDVDEDGFPNGDEFVAFTDPTNSASYFRATSVTNAIGPFVVVPSVTGRQYRLLWSPLLGVQTWTNVVAGPVAGTGGNISLGADNTATAVAVRLSVEMQ